MNREEREGMVDRLLNEALAPQEMEPRAGLEQRILANLRVQPEPRPWWRWMWAVAAVLIALLGGLRMTDHTPLVKPTVVAERQPSIVPAPKIVPVPATEVSRTHVRSQHGSRATPEMATSATPPGLPRQEVFPSPEPLGEQERLFYQFVQHSPREAVQVAQMQAVERLRSQQFMETGGAPEAAPVQ